MGVVKNIYTDIDLKGNELKNFRVPSLDDDPDVLDGGMYYNTKLKEFRFCIAGKWVNIFGGWYFDEDGNLCTDKTVIIDNNLIVTKDTSSGGEGQDTPAEGTVTGIEVNGTPYEPNTQGVIDLSAAFNAIDVSDQLKDYYTKTQTDSAISTAIKGLNIGQYAKTTDVNAALAKYLPLEGGIMQGNLDLGESLLTSSYYGETLDVISFGEDDGEGGEYATLNIGRGFASQEFDVNYYGYYINFMSGRVPALRMSIDDNGETTFFGVVHIRQTIYGEGDIETAGDITAEYLIANGGVECNSLTCAGGATFNDGATFTGDVRINGNLIVTKDTSSGGEGEDTAAEGTVTGIKVSSTQTLTPNTQGIIDMVSTLASIDVSDQLTGYATIDSLDALKKRVKAEEDVTATYKTWWANLNKLVSAGEDEAIFNSVVKFTDNVNGSFAYFEDLEVDSFTVNDGFSCDESVATFYVDVQMNKNLNLGATSALNFKNASGYYVKALHIDSNNNVWIGGQGANNIRFDNYVGLRSFSCSDEARFDNGFDSYEHSWIEDLSTDVLNVSDSLSCGGDALIYDLYVDYRLFFTTGSELLFEKEPGESYVRALYYDSDTLHIGEAGIDSIVLDSSVSMRGLTCDGEATFTGDVRINGNLIVTKDTSSAGSGEDTPVSGETTTTTAEWYNIKTRRNAATGVNIEQNFYNVIENYNYRLTDSSTYRMVVLRFKRGQYGSKHWAIPMFSARWDTDTGEIVHPDTKSTVPFENTWWPITSSEVTWFGNTGASLLTSGFSFKTREDFRYRTRFSNSNSKRMRMGTAIYKKMSDGRWQRVSNIAEVMLFVNDNDSISTSVVE